MVAQRFSSRFYILDFGKLSVAFSNIQFDLLAARIWAYTSLEVHGCSSVKEDGFIFHKRSQMSRYVELQATSRCIPANVWRNGVNHKPSRLCWACIIRYEYLLTIPLTRTSWPYPLTVPFNHPGFRNCVKFQRRFEFLPPPKFGLHVRLCVSNVSSSLPNSPVCKTAHETHAVLVDVP